MLPFFDPERDRGAFRQTAARRELAFQVREVDLGDVGGIIARAVIDPQGFASVDRDRAVREDRELHPQMFRVARFVRRFRDEQRFFRDRDQFGRVVPVEQRRARGITPGPLPSVGERYRP